MGGAKRDSGREDKRSRDGERVTGGETGGMLRTEERERGESKGED